MAKKSYVINCGSRCQELLERISEEIPGFFSASISGGSLRIEFDETYIGAREAIDAIKEIAREILAQVRSSASRIPVKLIQKRIGAPVILEPLIEILRLRGHRAEASSGYIETTAGVEEIVDIAMAISRCAEEMPREILTPTARRSIVVLCAHYDIGVEHIIKILEERGVLTREPGGRLGIRVDIQELKRIVEGS